MTQDMTQKEMLIRMMDKLENVEREQTVHHTFASSKLESIEAEAVKRDTRFEQLEKKTTLNREEISSAKTVFYTLSTALSIVWAAVTFVVK